MPKLPDFSELTKKLDLQGLLDSVKSAVSGAPPKAPEGDVIATKFVEIITTMQHLATAHAEQAKIIADIHHKLNALYKDIQATQQVTSPTEKSATIKTETKTTKTKAKKETEDAKEE